MKFSEWSPFIYEGKVDCRDCSKTFDSDGCDMRAGRELHRVAFEVGASNAVCSLCGNDEHIAAIGRRMGHRPDIAFAMLAKAERAMKNALEELSALRSVFSGEPFPDERISICDEIDKIIKTLDVTL